MFVGANDRGAIGGVGGMRVEEKGWVCWDLVKGFSSDLVCCCMEHLFSLIHCLNHSLSQ